MTNAKVVFINDDQCDIADNVLDVWLFLKKFNHPSKDLAQIQKCKIRLVF